MKKFLLAIALSLLSMTEAKIEQTLSIIKPDAVKAHRIGEIIATFEKNNLHIVALRMTKLSKLEAEAFYAVHKDRPFYNDLVAFMTSGPIVVQVLEGEDAVLRNREIMGPTDPKKAAAESLRARFGTSIQYNAVHGSDSEENAKTEIAFFFTNDQIFQV